MRPERWRRSTVVALLERFYAPESGARCLGTVHTPERAWAFFR